MKKEKNVKVLDALTDGNTTEEKKTKTKKYPVDYHFKKWFIPNRKTESSFPVKLYFRSKTRFFAHPPLNEATADFLSQTVS